MFACLKRIYWNLKFAFFSVSNKRCLQTEKKSLAKLRNVKVFGDSKATIVLGNNAYLEDCTIHLYGTGVISIGDDCCLRGVDFWFEDQHNEISVGAKTTTEGDVQLSCCESCKITVGDDCMLSSNIRVRTTDSHSILSLSDGLRLNKGADISIGDHVWVGMNVTVLKGAAIPSNSVVGCGAIVSGKLSEPNSVYAGAPAKHLKSGITWCRERV